MAFLIRYACLLAAFCILAPAGHAAVLECSGKFVAISDCPTRNCECPPPVPKGPPGGLGQEWRIRIQKLEASITDIREEIKKSDTALSEKLDLKITNLSSQIEFISKRVEDQTSNTSNLLTTASNSIAILAVFVGVVTVTVSVVSTVISIRGNAQAKAEAITQAHQTAQVEFGRLRDGIKQQIEDELAGARATVNAAKAEVNVAVAKLQQETAIRIEQIMVRSAARDDKDEKFTPEERILVAAAAARAEDTPSEKRTPTEWNALALRALEAGNPVQASEYLKNATAQNADHPWTWIILSRLRARTGDLEGAKEAAQKAVEIADRSGKDRDKSVAYNELGDIARITGDIKAARHAYEIAKNIRIQLAAENPEAIECKRDLSLSWNKIGDVAMRLQDLDGAWDAYNESRSIREELHKSNQDDPNLIIDFAVSLGNISRALKAKKDYTSATSTLNMAISLYYSLPIEFRLKTSSLSKEEAIWRLLSITHLANGKPREAWAACKQSIRVIAQLIRIDPTNVNWQKERARTLISAGKAARQQEKSKLATRLFERASRQLEALENSGRLDADARNALASLNSMRANSGSKNEPDFTEI